MDFSETAFDLKILLEYENLFLKFHKIEYESKDDNKKANFLKIHFIFESLNNMRNYFFFWKNPKVKTHMNVKKITFWKKEIKKSKNFLDSTDLWKTIESLITALLDIEFNRDIFYELEK